MYKKFLLKNKIAVNGIDEIDDISEAEIYNKEGEFDTVSEEKDISDSNEESEIFKNKPRNSSNSS